MELALAMAQRLNTIAAFPISAIPAAATSPAPAGLSAECAGLLVEPAGFLVEPAGLLVEPAGLLGPRKPSTRVAAAPTMPTTVPAASMVASQLRGGPSQFMAGGGGAGGCAGEVALQAGRGWVGQETLGCGWL